MLDEQQALKPDQNDRRFVRIGYILFAIVFVGFFGWALVAPLGSAAPAPGMIVVKNERKTIQHLEGGILHELLVRQGDQVTQGQLLARLDVTQIQANLDVVFAQLLSARAKIARLQAERANAESVEWPIADGIVDQARYRDVISEQQNLFVKRKNSLDGEVLILERRMAQLVSRIRGLTETRATQVNLLASFETELGNLQQLLAQGFVDETRVRDLERRVVELKGRIQQIDSDRQSAEIQMGETELQIMQRRAIFDADVQTQLAELQAQRVQLEEQYRVAQDRLTRAEIRAPSEGVVLNIEVTTEGGVVPASQPFMTIVPDDDDLVIEAQLNPIDRDRVRSGQAAEIQFSTFDMNSLPKIYGEVLSVSPDALVDRNTGLSYYLTVLALPAAELQKLGGSNLVPGMPVTVLIQTGERTLWEYLTKPITGAMSKALIEQ